MALFSYNTDDFLPLPSNKSSRQSTSAYISMKPCEWSSKVLSFSSLVNPLFFQENMFVYPSKVYMFLLQPDQFFILILGFLFCHVDDLFVQHLAHHVHVCLLSLLLLYITVKTFVIVLYIVILSVQVVVMFKVLVNLHSLLLVYLLVLQMSLNLLNSLPVNQLINLCISEKS